jgi:flavodoxin
MRKFKFIAVVLMCILCFAVVLTGCNSSDKGEESGKENTSTEDDATTDGNTEINGNFLIAFFSRADENYSVGYIEKGNTHIIAEMIQEEVGGDLFHIQRATAYPTGYSDCTAEAQREKNANARPALLETKDIDDYDIIFLGYPIWWGDMPMPVYTFIEGHNWNGKTVIPFCTHAGSGLSGTVGTLRTKCVGATVLDGFSIAGTTAQNSRTQARQSVTNWLNGLNLA